MEQSSNDPPMSPSSSHIVSMTKLSVSSCANLLKKFPGLESLTYSILKNILSEVGISSHGSSISMLLLLKRVEVYLH